MFSYVAIGLVLVYVLGFAVCFTGASLAVCQELDNAEDNLSVFSNERYITELNEGESVGDLLRTSQQIANRFPYVAIAYDKDGNIVAQTGTYISFVHLGEKRLYCYLDEYLTDEMKRDIAKLEKQAKKTYVKVSDFEFNLDGDKVIPVKLGLELGNGEENLTLAFSDKEANCRLDEENYVAAYITLYDMDENHYNRKLFDELREEVLSEERKKEALRGIENSGGGGISSYEYFFYDCTYRYDDDNFAIVEAGGFRPVMAVLDSDYLHIFLLEFTFGFAILAIVILILSNKLYNKNKQLENARIAFTSAAAHELKTPLAIISNLSECIIENIAPEKNGQ